MTECDCEPVYVTPWLSSQICVLGVRKSAGALSTAIEFTAKTSTSFKPTRWDFSAPLLLPLRCLSPAVVFLLFRYARARSASAWSITTCGRSLSVTSTLPSRPPGWPGRNSACSQGTRECCIIQMAPKLNHLISGLITSNNLLAVSKASPQD